MDEHHRGGMIDEQGASIVLVILLFFPIGVRQVAWNRTLVLVKGNAVARLEMVTSKHHFFAFDKGASVSARQMTHLLA